MSSDTSNRAWPLVMRFSAIWIVYIVWSACAGWLLSSLSMLNLSGYLIALIPLFVSWFATWKISSGKHAPIRRSLNITNFKKRWPWLILVTLCFVGGIAYPPTNYDALSYRLPRILYWWQDTHWYWLEHADDRMNYSGTGFEWQMLPLIIFTGSDRLLFLLNWLPFLLFPGLCFHTLRGIGVSARTSARWMWIIPMGYGFVLQSASIGNDAIGGILLAASVALCHFAVDRKLIYPLILSAFAASCFTALKLSNIPILLPVALVWLRSVWLLRDQIGRRHIGVGIAALPALALAGCLPLAVLNWQKSGNWAGDPDDLFQLRVTKPVPGLVGNSFNLVIGSIQLPVLPLPPKVRHDLMEPFKGENSLESYVHTGFPRFKATISAEIPREEGAGLGIGIALLMIAHVMQGRGSKSSLPFTRIVVTGTAISCLVYMAKMGSENTGRLLLSYYPVMIASFLAILPGRDRHSSLLKWAYFLLPFLCILPALFLNPNRPIIPPQTIAGLNVLPDKMQKRVEAVANGYANRNDPLAEMRRDLPGNCDTVGFAGSPSESSYSMFKPFGKRKVIEIHESNSTDLDWLVASPLGIQHRVGVDWDQWLVESPYQVVQEYEVFFAANEHPDSWYLLKKPEE